MDVLESAESEGLLFSTQVCLHLKLRVNCIAVCMI